MPIHSQAARPWPTENRMFSVAATVKKPPLNTKARGLLCLSTRDLLLSFTSPNYFLNLALSFSSLEGIPLVSNGIVLIRVREMKSYSTLNLQPQPESDSGQKAFEEISTDNTPGELLCMSPRRLLRSGKFLFLAALAFVLYGIE
jgi:hypothetical protein